MPGGDGGKGGGGGHTKKGDQKGKNGGGGSGGGNGSGAPGGGAGISYADAKKVFDQVVAMRDAEGRPPCVAMQVYGVCDKADPTKCTYSHDKKSEGKPGAIVLDNYQKKCCKIVLDKRRADAASKGKGGDQKGGGSGMAAGDYPKGKGRDKGKGKGKDDKGKGKGKEEKGKGGEKGKGAKCTNCGQKGHTAEKCPHPPKAKAKAEPKPA